MNKHLYGIIAVLFCMGLAAASQIISDAVIAPQSISSSVDLSLYNKSIDLSLYNYSIDLSAYNYSINLDAYNRSIDLSAYNYSINLDAYNRSIDLSAYNHSINLDAYNRSIDLSAYARHYNVEGNRTKATIDMLNNVTNATRITASSSIIRAATGIQLSGDALAPGAYMHYGTDVAGTKGWQSSYTSTTHYYAHYLYLIDDTTDNLKAGEIGTEDSFVLWEISTKGDGIDTYDFTMQYNDIREEAHIITLHLDMSKKAIYRGKYYASGTTTLTFFHMADGTYNFRSAKVTA